LEGMLRNDGMAILDYETLSTYINFVRPFDTKDLLFRRMFFYTLRSANLGADHFLISRKLS
jgi:hypothetical protein